MNPVLSPPEPVKSHQNSSNISQSPSLSSPRLSDWSKPLGSETFRSRRLLQSLDLSDSDHEYDEDLRTISSPTIKPTSRKTVGAKKPQSLGLFDDPFGISDPFRKRPSPATVGTGDSGIPPVPKYVSPVFRRPYKAAPSLKLSGTQPLQLSPPPKTRGFGLFDVTMVKLRSHADHNAGIYSIARKPPPTCHPKTRLEIRNKLSHILGDEHRQYKMLWLFGAAGTGKSAIGQTFSEECLGKSRLGAAFFFSRPNRRNKYVTVVPTIAHHLATYCYQYRRVVASRIDLDPGIFDKSPSVQLKKLIIEPLLELRSRITTTYLMLLDGVDQCGDGFDVDEREKEQRGLIRMIADTVRDYPDLPLFWLICSRPEVHLQEAFASIATICQREEIVIDTQCREEVKIVLREGLAKIAEKRSVMVTGWPSENEFETVERAVSGLHIFGAAILKDIEHSDSPVEQLKNLLPFLEHVAVAGQAGSRGIDPFYQRILDDVPSDRLSVTLEVLGFLIFAPDPMKLSAQALCNFLRVDQEIFSSALRKLSSVIHIPSPEAARNTSLHLYHASFSDFLTDTFRSGRYFIDRRKVLVSIIKSCFFWHQWHSNAFHSSDQPFIDSNAVRHTHGPLSDAHLKWITTDSHRSISDMVCRYAGEHCFALFGKIFNERDQDLLSVVHNSDLRHMSKHNGSSLIEFINWVYKQNTLDGFIRTEPNSNEDRMLLKHLKDATKNSPINSARLPINLDTRSSIFHDYLFIGRSTLSIIVWITKKPDPCTISGLNLDWKPPVLTIREPVLSLNWLTDMESRESAGYVRDRGPKAYPPGPGTGLQSFARQAVASELNRVEGGEGLTRGVGVLRKERDKWSEERQMLEKGVQAPENQPQPSDKVGTDTKRIKALERRLEVEKQVQEKLQKELREREKREAREREERKREEEAKQKRETKEKEQLVRDERQRERRRQEEITKLERQLQEARERARTERENERNEPEVQRQLEAVMGEVEKLRGDKARLEESLKAVIDRETEERNARNSAESDAKAVREEKERMVLQERAREVMERRERDRKAKHERDARERERRLRQEIERLGKLLEDAREQQEKEEKARQDAEWDARVAREQLKREQELVQHGAQLS